MGNFQVLLQSKMSEESYEKLAALHNDKVMEFIGSFVEHCEPASVFVCTDSEADIQYVRDQALTLGEEHTLSRDKQTIHWDGYSDQGRDKKGTRFLVYKENLDNMKALNAIEYEEGLAEIMSISKGIMKGKAAVVQFFSEGPTESASPFLVFNSPTVGTLRIRSSFYTDPRTTIFSG
jgi:phosphoenolpyruvate carboxykinase (GTP)